MEYKKIKEPAYNIHFIKTDKFKKIRIKINFKEELKKENIVIRNMLSLILLESSKKYPTKRLLDIECEELYNAGISSNTSISGNYHILSFQKILQLILLQFRLLVQIKIRLSLYLMTLLILNLKRRI